MSSLACSRCSSTCLQLAHRCKGNGFCKDFQSRLRWRSFMKRLCSPWSSSAMLPVASIVFEGSHPGGRLSVGRPAL